MSVDKNGLPTMHATFALEHYNRVEAAIYNGLENLRVLGDLDMSIEYSDGYYVVFADGSSISVSVTTQEAE